MVLLKLNILGAHLAVTYVTFGVFQQKLVGNHGQRQHTEHEICVSIGLKHPLLFAVSFPENPRDILHKPYIARS